MLSSNIACISAPAIVGLVHPAAGGWTWNCHHGNDNIQIHQGIQHAFANLVSRCQYSLQKNFANIANSRGSVVSTRNKNWVIWNFFSWCHCSYSVQCRFSSLLAQKRIFAGYNIFFHFSTNLKILWKFKVVCSAPMVKAPLTLRCVQAAAVRALWVATPGNCPYCRDTEFRHSLIHCLHHCLHWNIFSDPQQILTIIPRAAGLGLGHLTSVNLSSKCTCTGNITHSLFPFFVKLRSLWVLTLAL